jgi:uncharacterized membrane protein
MDAISTPVTANLAEEERTVAIVSYLTLLGFFAAIIINGGKRTKLGAFHLRQTLGFLITAVAGAVAVSTLSVALTASLFFIPWFAMLLIPVLWTAFGLTMLTMWLMGFIAAISGKMKPMPILGRFYERTFSRAFE